MIAGGLGSPAGQKPADHNGGRGCLKGLDCPRYACIPHRPHKKARSAATNPSAASIRIDLGLSPANFALSPKLVLMLAGARPGTTSPSRHSCPDACCHRPRRPALESGPIYRRLAPSGGPAPNPKESPAPRWDPTGAGSVSIAGLLGGSRPRRAPELRCSQNRRFTAGPII